MKTLFLLPILFLSLLSTSCWGVDWDDLVERDYIYYKKFTETPFTGKVSGKKQGEMKNGIKEGEWVNYHKNGKLRSKGSYKNGKKEGGWVSYHENGQLWNKGSYKNGKYENDWVWYTEDGEIWMAKAGTYKNGKKVSD